MEQKRLQRKQAMHCAADHAEVMQPPQLARPRDVVVVPQNTLLNRRTTNPALLLLLSRLPDQTYAAYTNPRIV